MKCLATKSIIETEVIDCPILISLFVFVRSTCCQSSSCRPRLLEMFTLPSLVCHFLQESKEKKLDKSKPVHHPFLDVRYQSPSFPKSAQFLDFQWTPKADFINVVLLAQKQFFI